MGVPMFHVGMIAGAIAKTHLDQSSSKPVELLLAQGDSMATNQTRGDYAPKGEIINDLKTFFREGVAKKPKRKSSQFEESVKIYTTGTHQLGKYYSDDEIARRFDINTVNPLGWALYDAKFEIIDLCEFAKKKNPDWQKGLETRRFTRQHSLKILKEQFRQCMVHGDSYASFERNNLVVCSYMIEVPIDAMIRSIENLVTRTGVGEIPPEWRVTGVKSNRVFHTWSTHRVMLPVEEGIFHEVSTVDGLADKDDTHKW